MQFPLSALRKVLQYPGQRLRFAHVLSTRGMGVPDMGAQASPPAECSEEQERCMVRDELRRAPKTLGTRAARPHNVDMKRYKFAEVKILLRYFKNRDR